MSGAMHFDLAATIDNTNPKYKDKILTNHGAH
jgi:hypothetical protein